MAKPDVPANSDRHGELEGLLGNGPSTVGAWWCRSDYFENVWTCVERGPYGEHPYHISFEMVMPDGLLLTDTKHSRLCDMVRRAAFGCREGDERLTDDGDRHRQIVNDSACFAIWMSLQGLSRPGDLTLEHLHEFSFQCLTGGVEGALRIDDRLRQGLADMRERRERPPTNAYQRLNHNALAGKCGVDLRRGTRHASTLLREHEVWALQTFSDIKKSPMYYKRTPPKEKSDDEGWVLNAKRLREILRTVVWIVDNSEDCRLQIPAGWLAEQVDSAADDGRTKTIPPLQGMYLLDRAVRWVFHYAEPILELKRAREKAEAELKRDRFGNRSRNSVYQEMEKQLSAVKQFEMVEGNLGKDWAGVPHQLLRPKASYASGPGDPWPIDIRDNNNRERQTLKRTVRQLLPAACFIIIAGLVARRLSEVETLPPGAVSADKEGYLWLRCWIEKTYQNWGELPCPTAVAAAVEVLQNLGAPFLKGPAERKSIFHIFSWDGGAAVNIPYAISQFCRHIDMPPLANGESWRLRPHQLRRFFAVTYFYRWDYPQLTALSQFLQHFDPTVTLLYVTSSVAGEMIAAGEANLGSSSFSQAALQAGASVNIDRDLAKIWEEEGENFTVSRFMSVKEGRAIGGGLKRTLDRWVRFYMSRITIVTPDGFDAAARHLHRDRRIQISSEAHADCGLPSKARDRDLAKAKCLEGLDVHSVLGPRKERAGPTVCGRCSFSLILPHHERAWLDAIERHRSNSLSAKAGSVLHERACRELAAAEQLYKAHFGRVAPSPGMKKD